jgi:hypothetical protein
MDENAAVLGLNSPPPRWNFHDAADHRTARSVSPAGGIVASPRAAAFRAHGARTDGTGT